MCMIMRVGWSRLGIEHSWGGQRRELRGEENAVSDPRGGLWTGCVYDHQGRVVKIRD